MKNYNLDINSTTDALSRRFESTEKRIGRLWKRAEEIIIRNTSMGVERDARLIK